MKKSMKILVLFSLLLISFNVMADKRKEFIRKYKHIAIREMERTGIPASITLAQGILESGCGESELAVNANNHFGIKCHETWNGDTYTMDDDTRDECFRKYKNIEQSWIDHSDFLTSRPRYAGLFSIPTTDYKAWAKGLKAAGYATNPQYANMLIKIIEEEELYKFDRSIKRRGTPPTITAEEFAQSVATQDHRNHTLKIITLQRQIQQYPGPRSIGLPEKEKEQSGTGIRIPPCKSRRYYVQHLTAIRSTAQKSLQVQLPVGRQSADRRRKDLSA